MSAIPLRVMRQSHRAFRSKALSQGCIKLSLMWVAFVFSHHLPLDCHLLEIGWFRSLGLRAPSHVETFPRYRSFCGIPFVLGMASRAYCPKFQRLPRIHGVLAFLDRRHRAADLSGGVCRWPAGVCHRAQGLHVNYWVCGSGSAVSRIQGRSRGEFQAR